MIRPRRILHPATALFAILLFFASLYLPPYEIDIDHWFPFVGTATAIRNGIWPYIGGYDPGYGFLRPAFLAAWVAAFGLSALSLSAMLMLTNLLAGAAAFALIHRLTASRVVALVGACRRERKSGSLSRPTEPTRTKNAPISSTTDSIMSSVAFPIG